MSRASRRTLSALRTSSEAFCARRTIAPSTITRLNHPALLLLNANSTDPDGDTRADDAGLYRAVAVRRALEAWQKIEPEKQWPPTREEREVLSKKERLACLRWSLHQAAHPAAHTGEDEWFKADAQFMLVTLCGLLAARS